MNTPLTHKCPLASASLVRGLLPVLLLSVALLRAKADIGYQFVTVGNPGNLPDSSTGNLYGAVGYTYQMGTYDVTLAQYAVFLNAVAATDSQSLYNPNMGTDLNIAGIVQLGSPGSYTYVVSGSGNRPVTYVSWFDAARMANWMQNGQQGGNTPAAIASTEIGAYTLNGATSGIFTKNAGATIYIPTEDEWYKAAYYLPIVESGNPYWSYATTRTTPPGNNAFSPRIPNNQANYNNGVFSTTQSTAYSASQNYLTDVGLFSTSPSPSGTFDQSGDVNQWNDAVISGTVRGQRGGSWDRYFTAMESSGRSGNNPTFEFSSVGFRLASVPEPSSFVLIGFGCWVLASKRRRRF